METRQQATVRDFLAALKAKLNALPKNPPIDDILNQPLPMKDDQAKEAIKIQQKNALLVDLTDAATFDSIMKLVTADDVSVFERDKPLNAAFLARFEQYLKECSPTQEGQPSLFLTDCNPVMSELRGARARVVIAQELAAFHNKHYFEFLFPNLGNIRNFKYADSKNLTDFDLNEFVFDDEGSPVNVLMMLDEMKAHRTRTGLKNSDFLRNSFAGSKGLNQIFLNRVIYHSELSEQYYNAIAMDLSQEMTEEKRETQISAARAEFVAALANKTYARKIVKPAEQANGKFIVTQGLTYGEHSILNLAKFITCKAQTIDQFVAALADVNHLPPERFRLFLSCFANEDLIPLVLGVRPPAGTKAAELGAEILKLVRPALIKITADDYKSKVQLLKMIVFQMCLLEVYSRDRLAPDAPAHKSMLASYSAWMLSSVISSSSTGGYSKQENETRMNIYWGFLVVVANGLLCPEAAERYELHEFERYLTDKKLTAQYGSTKEGKITTQALTHLMARLQEVAVKFKDEKKNETAQLPVELTASAPSPSMRLS